MTTAEKLSMLKTLLHVTDTTLDAELTVYLDLSEKEILSWMYSATGTIPDDVATVPTIYIPTQIMSCMAGYGLSGAENETSHSENGVSRSFKYSDMVDYIRSHVLPYVGVI